MYAINSKDHFYLIKYIIKQNKFLNIIKETACNFFFSRFPNKKLLIHHYRLHRRKKFEKKNTQIQFQINDSNFQACKNSRICKNIK